MSPPSSFSLHPDQLLVGWARWQTPAGNLHFVYLTPQSANPGLNSLGDLKYKRFGVTPEPEVRTKLLEGGELRTKPVLLNGIDSMIRIRMGVYCCRFRRYIIDAIR